MDPAGELTQLLEGLTQLLARAREQAARLLRRVLQARLRETQGERERDEALLGAVVEVALEPATRVVAGLHEPRARGAELFLVPAALGDVDPRDEEALGALLIEQRR